MPNVIISFDSGYVKNNGEKAVYASVRMGKRKVKFNTGVSVKPEDFDESKCLVRKSRKDYSDLNLMISSTKSRINDIFIRYRLQFEELTPDLLLKEYRISSTRIDFHTFLKEAIAESRGELANSTILQHVSHSNKLRRFSPTISFSMLDSEFMVKYNRYLMVTEKNDINTRYTAFKFLKLYINIAIRKRIITYNPLKDWMPAKQASTERVFLTEDEVRILVMLYLKKSLPKTEQIVLRHFLFMCFTGLRISDLKAVEMDQVMNGTLIFSAQKTRNKKMKLIKVPLPPMAIQLIKDEAPFRVSGKIFNTFSEQHTRRTIKDLVKKNGIEKDVSLHTGRHTFATLFLRKTKNIAVLQKLLGHSKIEQTMVYAHVLTEDIETEMENAFSDF
ncbi:MAG: site-specific integrase [Bacteroidales bacterium]|nr:site-specific integrase [Bacteroidales bacterium]